MDKNYSSVRTKVTKIPFRGDETFVRRKICPTKFCPTSQGQHLPRAFFRFNVGPAERENPWWERGYPQGFSPQVHIKKVRDPGSTSSPGLLSRRLTRQPCAVERKEEAEEALGSSLIPDRGCVDSAPDRSDVTISSSLSLFSFALKKLCCLEKKKLHQVSPVGINGKEFTHNAKGKIFLHMRRGTTNYVMFHRRK